MARGKNSMRIESEIVDGYKREILHGQSLNQPFFLCADYDCKEHNTFFFPVKLFNDQITIDAQNSRLVSPENHADTPVFKQDTEEEIARTFICPCSCAADHLGLSHQFLLEA